MNKETSLKALKVLGIIKIVLGIMAIPLIVAFYNHIREMSTTEVGSLLMTMQMLAVIAPIIMILSGVLTLLVRKKGFIFWIVFIFSIINLLAQLYNLFTGNDSNFITIIMEIFTILACYGLVK